MKKKHSPPVEKFKEELILKYGEKKVNNKEMEEEERNRRICNGDVEISIEEIKKDWHQIVDCPCCGGTGKQGILGKGVIDCVACSGGGKVTTVSRDILLRGKEGVDDVEQKSFEDTYRGHRSAIDRDAQRILNGEIRLPLGLMKKLVAREICFDGAGTLIFAQELKDRLRGIFFENKKTEEIKSSSVKVAGGIRVFFGIDSPDKPTKGHVWFNTTTMKMNMYDSDKWKEIGVENPFVVMEEDKVITKKEDPAPKIHSKVIKVDEGSDRDVFLDLWVRGKRKVCGEVLVS